MRSFHVDPVYRKRYYADMTDDNAARLKAWRERQVPKLSQRKAALLIDAKQRTWASWEEGRSAPDLDNCIRLQVLTGNEVPAVGWVKRRKKPDESGPALNGSAHEKAG